MRILFLPPSGKEPRTTEISGEGRNTEKKARDSDYSLGTNHRTGTAAAFHISSLFIACVIFVYVNHFLLLSIFILYVSCGR